MKKLLFALLYATGVLRLVAWLNREKITILCYHSVTRRPPSVSSDPFKMHLRLELFLQHLDHLQRNYRVISLNDFVKARRENIKVKPYSVVLTFDDGFRNFLTLAAPILIQRGLPATAFIVTNKSSARNNSSLNGQWTPGDDESFLSWDEVRTLAQQGIDFGSHTCSHPRLLSISAEATRSELEDSLTAISSHLEHDGLSLSYPHGQTSEPISRLAESVGYRCAVTTRLGPNDARLDLFALRRTVVASDDNLSTFAARVSGLTWWASKLPRSLAMPEPQLICSEPLVADRLEN